MDIIRFPARKRPDADDQPGPYIGTPEAVEYATQELRWAALRALAICGPDGLRKIVSDIVPA